MKPFKSPKLENFMFTSKEEGSLSLAHIEEEITTLLDLLKERKKIYKHVKYCLVYCKSSVTPQYVVSSTIVAGKGELWHNISLSLFNLISENLTFELSQKMQGLTIYTTEPLTVNNICLLINSYSRNSFLDIVMNNL